jgi:hypothetical protein
VRAVPNITLLRSTVGALIGKVLTPEDAARIEMAAHEAFGNVPAQQPERAIDPGQFDPLSKGEFTIQVERLRDVLPELQPLHVEHWQETEGYRHGLELDPDYERMLAIERAGGLIQFTVRRAGDLVGNLRLYVGHSMHSRSVLVANEDTLYLTPSARGGMTAMSLMRYGERALVGLGVRQATSDSKLVNNADVLMRRLGYQHFAHKFVKFFKDTP